MPDRRAEAMPPLGSFRWLVLLTSVATYALVVLGGVVRTTESGDACPDWPRCNGELIPAFDSAVLIEFSHRMLASVVGILVLAVAVYAWRSHRHRPVIVWGATAALLLVAGQIVLGGLTVLNDLPPTMVTAHLAMAATLLATLTALTMVSFADDTTTRSEGSPVAASFRNLALFTAAAMFALMLSGSYVTGSGAGLAFPDWPLFDGQLLPDGGRLAMIHAMHRIAAVAVGLLVGHVALRAWRERDNLGLATYGAILALVLYVAQIFVGASNIWTSLQPAAGATHLALAVGIWTVLVVVTMAAHNAAQPAVAGATAPRAGSPGLGAGPEEGAAATLPVQGRS